MAGVDFVHVLQVVLFMFNIWASGRTFKFFKQPAILGYLLCGIFMGPKFLDMVPYASDGMCDTMVSRQSSPPPFPPPSPLHPPEYLIVGEVSGSSSGSGSHGECDGVLWGRWAGVKYTTSIWTLIGNVGVTLMIFQSGMHIHFDKVHECCDCTPRWR